MIFRKKELRYRIRADVNSNSALFRNIKVNEGNHKIMLAFNYILNTRLCNIKLHSLFVPFVRIANLFLFTTFQQIYNDYIICFINLKRRVTLIV